MVKIGIIGPESSGKSTLAQQLARRYGEYIPEYARDYVAALNGHYTYADVLTIARHQVEQLRTLDNEARSDDERVLFFDTELIVTKVWLEHKYGTCPEWVTEALRRYPMDIYLLCTPDIPWIADPTRENPHIRQYLFNWYEREIQALDIPYYIIRH